MQGDEQLISAVSYEPPTVSDLGTLGEITGSVDNKGTVADGGMGSTDKT
jgi:hypothetical protein